MTSLSRRDSIVITLAAWGMIVLLIWAIYLSESFRNRGHTVFGERCPRCGKQMLQRLTGRVANGSPLEYDTEYWCGGCDFAIPGPAERGPEGVEPLDGEDYKQAWMRLNNIAAED
jgi:predicted RNA-binding Zn-ribbon protein involved in translation (DUF1610 family)